MANMDEISYQLFRQQLGHEVFNPKDRFEGKELCVALSISRTHLIRKMKEKNIEPIKSTLHTQKKLYMVADIEKAFNIKINDGSGPAGSGTGENRNFIDEVGDILKEE